jgi:hypothetical protein
VLRTYINYIYLYLQYMLNFFIKILDRRDEAQAVRGAPRARPSAAAATPASRSTASSFAVRVETRETIEIEEQQRTMMACCRAPPLLLNSGESMVRWDGDGEMSGAVKRDVHIGRGGGERVGQLLRCLTVGTSWR